jgi:hypothetical protein
MTNRDFLLTALSWLEQRLQHKVAENDAPASTENHLSQRVNWSVIRDVKTRDLPRFVELSTRLRLTSFEEQLLLLCLAIELEPHFFATLCAKVQRQPTQRYATFHLAFSLFEPGHWDVTSPERPLRYWHLISLHQSAETPLTQAALRIDERILSYVQGYHHLDLRLRPYLFPMPTQELGERLPPSQGMQVDKLVRAVRENPTGEVLPVMQLVGVDTESKQLVVEQVAATLGVQLFHLPTTLLPKLSGELSLFARLWEREGTLWPVALYLDADDLNVELEQEAVALVQRFLARSGGLFFLSSRDAWNGMERARLTLDVRKPSPEEQGALWKKLLKGVDKRLPAQLSGQFNLALPAIERVVRAVQKENHDLPTDADIWQACLVETRPRLDMLAQRIIPKATWHDIVLAEAQMTLLKQIAAQVEQRGQVYDDWGWRRKMSRGLGMTVLFSGESGTGKTMSAEILANHLNLNLYRIDLSQVVSKYIGETEKNLRKLFDAAEDGGVILFFDEADALFGKRTAVRDSHDRYANIETNYLLQRLEAYQGLAILASNLQSSLDDAFMRRLRFVVKFPMPENTHRKQIWRQVFPPETPLKGLDYNHLAGFQLSGGSIYNIALNASFYAATKQSPVTMPLVLEATRIEFDKVSKLIKPSDFIWGEEE